MTRSTLAAVAVVLAIGLRAGPARAFADEPAPDAPALPSTEILSADEIAALCVRLGVSDYAVREEATQQLLAAGKGVICDVASTADAGNLEVAIRSLQILKELYDGPTNRRSRRPGWRSRNSRDRATRLNQEKGTALNLPVLRSVRYSGLALSSCAKTIP